MVFNTMQPKCKAFCKDLSQKVKQNSVCLIWEKNAMVLFRCKYFMKAVYYILHSCCIAVLPKRAKHGNLTSKFCRSKRYFSWWQKGSDFFPFLPQDTCNKTNYLPFRQLEKAKGKVRVSYWRGHYKSEPVALPCINTLIADKV